MSRRNPALIYLFVLLAMLFCGMSFVWSTIVFEYYHPITTVFIRLVLSTAILWVFVKFQKDREKVQRRDYKLFALSALFNPFLYFIGENFGLQMTSPTISAVIIATIPLLTPVLGMLLLNERLTRLNWIGMIISFSGILIMLVRPDLTLTAPPLGVLLLAMAVFTAVGYSVLLKKLSSKYSALTIITTQNMLGVCYFLPLFLIFDFSHFISVIPDRRLVLAIVQLAFFASTLAYIFYTLATKHLGISRTNIFTNLIPVFTSVFSYYILDEFFTINKVAGMIIVITGVILSQINRSKGVMAVYRYIFINKRKNI